MPDGETLTPGAEPLFCSMKTRPPRCLLAAGAIASFLSAACDAPQYSPVPHKQPTSSADAPTAAGDRSYAYGTIIRCGLRGEFERYRGSGWSHAEDGITWTDGPAAKLVVTVPPSEYRLEFRLRAAGMRNPPDLVAQPVEVWLNGSKIAEWSVSEMADHIAEIPSGSLRERGDLAIEFRLPMARSPLALGVSADPRVLGIQCAQFEFREIPQ